jgi:hypothetical protein
VGVSVFKYANRALLAAYLLVWTVWASSQVGEMPPCVAHNWTMPWSLLLNFLVVAFMAWFAALEYVREKKEAA